MAGGRRRQAMVATIAVFLALTVLTAILIFVFTRVDMGEKPHVGDAASVLLAVVPLAAGLIFWLRRTLAAPAPGDITDVKTTLAGLVCARWEEETAIRSQGAPRIPIAWHLTGRATLKDHPRLVADGELVLTGGSADVAALAASFRRLRRRRLVITGGAGTGKTTLAVELLLELVRTRAPDEPVPVLLSIADWDMEVHPYFHDWLAARLRTDFATVLGGGRGPDGADLLARRGHTRSSAILPILDGLDELPGPARAKVIITLNRTLAEGDQVIVTSRTTEYADAVKSAKRVLKAAAVIAPMALSREVAVGYLADDLPPNPPYTWEETLRALGRARLRHSPR